jgi:crotonyl-CoA carboxylase/reductase
MAATVGAKPIAVISGEEKADYVKSMGAVGIIDRRNFDCWGALPDMNDAEGFNAYMKRARSFGRAI